MLKRIASALFYSCLVVTILLLGMVPNSRYLKLILSKEALYKQVPADIHNHFSEQEVKIAKQLLPVPTNLTTQQKVLLIEEFIKDTITHVPINAHGSFINFKLPNSQAITYLTDCLKKKIQPDCGAYTSMMNLFFFANEINFRAIGVNNIPDTAIGNHTFSEVYVPEKKQWMYTDMNCNVFCLQDSVGNFLNTLQTQNAIFQGLQNIKCYQYTLDSVQQTKWQPAASITAKCLLPVVQYNFYTNNTLSATEKIKHLLLPKPWYVAFWQQNENGNYLFWIRFCTQWVAIVLGIYLLFSRNKSQK